MSLIEHEHTDGDAIAGLTVRLAAASGDLVVQLDALATIEHQDGLAAWRGTEIWTINPDVRRAREEIIARYEERAVT